MHLHDRAGTLASIIMAKFSYIHWSYGTLHKKVCEMIATICDTFVWRFSCGYTHKVLKQLASKAKHLGQYCIRLSYGYSRGTKVISKQNIEAKIPRRQANEYFTNFSMQDTRLNCSRGNFLTHLECISKVSMQFRAPRPMWPRLPTINYLSLWPR